MSENKTELSINTEVLEKMAELAAKEVEGVAGLTKKAVDIKGILKTKSAFKGVKVENINGAINISAYICVKQGVDVKDVAEKVQQSIKDKIQTMTGSAVTRVNVSVCDIDIRRKDRGIRSHHNKFVNRSLQR